jgi:hypothetical protein
MIIEFVQTKEQRTPYFRNDAFSFRKDRPFHLLQRLCCWVMRKLMAFDIGENISYTKHIIDTRSFIDRLFKQQDHIKGHFNRRPTRLLIGAEDFAALMGTEEIRQMLTFRAEYGYNKEIMGLMVEVIPWMRGILVMPEK